MEMENNLQTYLHSGKKSLMIYMLMLYECLIKRKTWSMNENSNKMDNTYFFKNIATWVLYYFILRINQAVV